MKIIDSNKDYYDFYQNIYRDDHNTFDRRDSFNLSKETFASFMKEITYPYSSKIHKKAKTYFVLLQICNNFWLFEVTVTKVNEYKTCKEYEMSKMAEWKDYSKEKELIKLAFIDVNTYLFSYWYIFGEKNIEKEKAEKEKNRQRIIEAVKNGEYEEEYIFGKYSVLNRKTGKKEFKLEEKNIPILKDIGIPALVEPLDVYLALDEYFSAKKQEGERTESIGLTDIEKVENHGFDKKNSFRGKA